MPFWQNIRNNRYIPEQFSTRNAQIPTETVKTSDTAIWYNFDSSPNIDAFGFPSYGPATGKGSFFIVRVCHAIPQHIAIPYVLPGDVCRRSGHWRVWLYQSGPDGKPVPHAPDMLVGRHMLGFCVSCCGSKHSAAARQSYLGTVFMRNAWSSI